MTRPVPAEDARSRPDPIGVGSLAAHNRERKKEGRDPLKLSEKLSQAALVHAKDMAEHHKLDHTGSDKSTVAERVKRQGYPYVMVGENIADGQKDVDEVMATWMESPGHRENILAEFTEMGAARVKDDEGVNYWCVDLGTPIPQLKPSEAAAALVKYLNDDRKKREKPLLKAETEARQGRHGDQRGDGQERHVQARRRPVQTDRDRRARGREFRILLERKRPDSRRGRQIAAG